MIMKKILFSLFLFAIAFSFESNASDRTFRAPETSDSKNVNTDMTGVYFLNGVVTCKDVASGKISEPGCRMLIGNRSANIYGGVDKVFYFSGMSESELIIYQDDPYTKYIMSASYSTYGNGSEEIECPVSVTLTFTEEKLMVVCNVTVYDPDTKNSVLEYSCAFFDAEYRADPDDPSSKKTKVSAKVLTDNLTKKMEEIAKNIERKENKFNPIDPFGLWMDLI